MLLGPEGTSPAPVERVLLSLGCRALIPVLIPSHGWLLPSSRGFSGWVPGFPGCGGVVGQEGLVGWCGDGGLVGVCELDSGCEHLVVMFCGL